MGMEFQMYRAWANASKGLRQYQKFDKAMQDGNFGSAGKHLDKGLNYFATAAEHLVKAEEDAEIKAGKLVDAGNQQLQEAIDLYAGGHDERAAIHYEKALDKYDEALALIDY